MTNRGESEKTPAPDFSKDGALEIWLMAIVGLPFLFVAECAELCKAAWKEIDRRRKP